MQRKVVKSFLFFVFVAVAAAQPPGHRRPPGQNKPKPNKPFNQHGEGFPQGPVPGTGAIVPAPPVPAQGFSQVPSGSVPPTNPQNAAVNAPQPGAAPNGNNVSGLMGILNGGNLGSATAGGAGNGAVQNGAAIGQGTGIANAGPGGFGIGLGIGGAVATPLGNLSFGTGESIAVGK